MRVLYVDDDRVQSVLFVAACRAAGLEDVETAGDADEALQGLGGAWGAWRPELLVIDLHLPDMDGLRLLPRLRQVLEETAGAAARRGGASGRVPAVLCTADEPAAVMDAARAAGFDDCWPKPATPANLLAARRRYTRGAFA